MFIEQWQASNQCWSCDVIPVLAFHDISTEPCQNASLI
jgi:hypothetical protein